MGHPSGAHALTPRPRNTQPELQGAECYLYPTGWWAAGHCKALPLVQGGTVSGWTSGREAQRQQLWEEDRAWAGALLALILVCNTWWSLAA